MVPCRQKIVDQVKQIRRRGGSWEVVRGETGEVGPGIMLCGKEKSPEGQNKPMDGDKNRKGEDEGGIGTDGRG